MPPRRKKRSPLRIMVLVHEDLVPPDTIEGVPDTELVNFKTEFDVISALKDMGHNVQVLGLATDLGVLRRALLKFRPHITFNLMEEFHGVSVYDHHVVSYLELMKRRYTGCNPRGLMLAHDKALSKQILSYHRIPVPQFHVFPMGRKVRVPGKTVYPMMVKSLTLEGSEGIAQASVVHDEEHLVERAEFIHRQHGTDAIAEAYIEGRELYVGVLGNDRLQTLPVWELRFTKMPDDVPRIATSKVKWDWEYQKKRGIIYGKAQAIEPQLEARIVKICKRTYRSLFLTGYARIDLRVTDDGQCYVLEANPNPDLAFGAELAEAAEAAGMSYEALMDRIVRMGLQYRAEWQE